MQVGTPVISTTIGAEAMILNGMFNGVIADSAEDFANAAIALYKSEVNWKQAQKTGFEIITSKFSKKICYSSFATDLEELSIEIETHRKGDFTSLLVQQQSLLSTKYMSKWIEEKNKLS